LLATAPHHRATSHCAVRRIGELPRIVAASCQLAVPCQNDKLAACRYDTTRRFGISQFVRLTEFADSMFTAMTPGCAAFGGRIVLWRIARPPIGPNVRCRRPSPDLPKIMSVRTDRSGARYEERMSLPVRDPDWRRPGPGPADQACRLPLPLALR